MYFGYIRDDGDEVYGAAGDGGEVLGAAGDSDEAIGAAGDGGDEGAKERRCGADATF